MIYCLTSHFGMNKASLCVYLFTSMHVLIFFYFEYVWYVLVIKSKQVYGSRLLFYYLSKKGVPWKFWLDPRFFRDLKLKWILKWLPFDRGYFKIYFYKEKSLLIISCHTYLLTRKFIILFQVIFVLSCILFSLKYPVIRCY